MDQKKIGLFLKELRKEKGITQEQLSEKLGVSSRTISRWENGVNMPDFDLVIELANFYDVSIEELLNGERMESMIDKKTEEAMLLAADYSSNKNMVFIKRMHRIFIIAVAAFIIYLVIDIAGMADNETFEMISSVALGLDFGVLIAGVIFTSKYASRIQAFKKRLLRRGSED